jgi:trans-2,3-dihydro-3-hydroxyanthranilate isomerase
VPNGVEASVLSVFIDDDPLRGGNTLGVVPDAAHMTEGSMRAVASTLNFSESTFVTSVGANSYEMRIFTPREELPFAGHPTLGTSWLLNRMGLLTGDAYAQRTTGGLTPVHRSKGLLWFERKGESDADLFTTKPQLRVALADALGIEPEEIGLEAREFGRAGRLEPAFSDAGLYQLMVPVKDLSVLERCSPRADLLRALTPTGVYCFTARAAGKLQARGLFSPIGIEEDPATGSAAGGLGLYLDERVGAVDIEIVQGAEMGRPSRLFVRSGGDTVQVGGKVGLVMKGTLDLPE